MTGNLDILSVVSTVLLPNLEPLFPRPVTYLIPYRNTQTTEFRASYLFLD
jgi:hypothetical protein